MRIRRLRLHFGLLAGLLVLSLLPSLASARYPAAVTPASSGAADRASLSPYSPGDWPMYGHDPARTNYNPDETIISAGNVNQLVQRWQANVGSNGTPTSAAPSVVGGRVYAGSSAASPANNFFTFDATTGAQIWAENIGYRSSCFNVGLGSTPAISGTMIVMGADNAAANPAYYGISAINGSVVWTNTMSVGPSGFPWASALTSGNTAYIGIASRCDNPSVRGEVRALDLSTGALLANQYFVGPGEAGGGIWNSPALSPDGTKLFVGTGEDYSCNPCTYTRALVSMDAATLAILQYHQEPSPNADLDFGTTPVVFHDSQGRTLVAAGHKNGTFYAYDAANINAGAIWTRSGGTSIGLMPAYDPSFGTGGTLFVVNSSITAVDPANGAVRWGPVSIPSTHGNIAIANGLIFINGGSSGLQIRNEVDGSLLRTITPANAGAANSGVAVSNGFIYWLSGSYLNAWSLPAGITPTVTPMPPSPTSTTPPSATSTSIPVATSTPVASNTPQATTTQPAATSTPVATATSQPQVTATPCAISFTDVPTSDPFYPYIRCLACRGIVSGYADGTFRPGNNVTRGQLSKIVSNAANFQDDVTGRWTYTDVPPSNTFWVWVERLTVHEVMGGYPCGGPEEPCDPQNRPYFRWGNNATRGQISKIVSNAAGYNEPPSGQMFTDVPPANTFYEWVQRLASRGIMGGYQCGIDPNEPCDPENRPYFRPFNNATRGQTAKIVANTFFPNCETPR